jgi:hypothetical protein
VDVISCDTDLSGQNPFGEVIRGVLRLRGYFIEANICTLSADQAQSRDLLRLEDKDGKWFATMDADEHHFWTPTVWCIPMIKTLVSELDGLEKSRRVRRTSRNSFCGLVLVQTGATENEYRELGISLQLQR